MAATDAILTGTPGFVREEVAAGLLHPLSPTDLPPISSQVGVVSLRGRTLSPIAIYAIDFLTRLMQEQATA